MVCVLRVGFGEVGTIEFPIAVNGNLGGEWCGYLLPRTIDR